MKKKHVSVMLIWVIVLALVLPMMESNKVSAASITILEPQTGWHANQFVTVRASVSGSDVTQVEVYYATGSSSYPPTPVAVQQAITGRNDYFFSIDLGSYANTTSGKLRVVAKNASNQSVATAEVTQLKKTNLSTSLGSLKDGAVVLKSGSTTTGTRFVLWSKHATKAQVWIYGNSDTGTDAPVKVMELIKQNGTVNEGAYWVADVMNDGSTVYGQGLHYGVRVWGPNWPYNSQWRPGTGYGFVQDVDSAGNRYNPNKLLLDPYAKAMSKDPDWSNDIFKTGSANRNRDSAGMMGKGIVYDPSTYNWGSDQPLQTPMKDSIIYETHVRGFTQHASSGVANKGTYKGVTQKVGHLNDLGITAVEFLPVHETINGYNDRNPNNNDWDNYWGYSTVSFFAPDRRYSSDQSATGPINEFKDMVKTLHANGKEVILDVVYNHTAEGKTGANNNEALLLSFKGIDNQVYYSLTADRQNYMDNTCCGNFNVAHPKVTQFVIDSLKYWAEEMHVDGFRYDLASVLGNTIQHGGFHYSKQASLLNRIYQELPNSKHIAEPWAIGGNSYQPGNFPGSIDAGQNAWSEWNDKFRDTMRRLVRGDDGQVPDLATRVAGSSDLFGDDGRRPYSSVNKITAHDGFTLNDLVSYNVKNNNQAYPYGPSDGGTDNNISWDTGGNETLRRQQIRNFGTHLMLSAGTPMLLGGDEMRRTQLGNNNAYNLDTVASWYDWNLMSSNQRTYQFFKGIIQLRKDHPAFRRGSFYTGTDHNSDGISDIQWHGVNYRSPDWTTGSRTLAWRIDGAKAETGASVNDNDFYIAANHYWGALTFQLPPNHPGKKWYRVIDTASWAENAATISNNVDQPGQEDQMTDGTWTNTWATSFAGNSSYQYLVNPRSMVVFIEK
ncbi:glycogen debranching protein [Marinicrinis sediminis]|uniref:Glycogen debranching protein n=1 Tax=Marinicrinis sediminis TaxID=1652465 RepID=A0ABW5RE57_9BACL